MTERMGIEGFIAVSLQSSHCGIQVLQFAWVSRRTSISFFKLMGPEIKGLFYKLRLTETTLYIRG